MSTKINVHRLPNIDLSGQEINARDLPNKINVRGLPNKDLSLERDKKVILHQ